jgi:hypothetical protein
MVVSAGVKKSGGEHGTLRRPFSAGSGSHPSSRKKLGGREESARQQHHRFDVKRLRKQIEQMCLFDAIAGRDQGGKIPGQRCRIARHIADALRSEFHQRAGHRFAGAGAGRVQGD